MTSNRSTLERALEKAESQGYELKYEPIIDDETEFMQQEDPAETVPTSPLKNIVYSQTRSVKIDERALTEKRIVVHTDEDPRADIFRMLRTKVLRQMRNNDWTTLAVTGATPGAGKTFVTINLAIAIAMELNQTVMIVDVDLRRPKVDWYFNLDVEFGLIDYLEHRAKLKDILVHPGIERLVVLPGRGTTHQSSELLSSPRMVKLVEDIKSRYDSRIILFDLPPLLPADDALMFLPNVDSALLVVEDGKNTADEITRSLRLLLDGTNFIGSVLNKASRTPDHQHY